MHSKLSRFVAETVGTFFLVYTICCNVRVMPNGGALCVGAVLTAMIYALGPVSGAHLNPAVSLGIYLSGRSKISFIEMGLYMICQLFGASLAGLSYAFFFREAAALEPVDPYTTGGAFVVEMLFSMVLVYIVLNVATVSNSNQYFGLSIGFTVTASAIAIGGISNCCLNPAVALGSLFPVFIHWGSDKISHYPIYFFAPLVGAFPGALAFYLVRRKEEYEPLDIGLLKLRDIVPTITSPTVSSMSSTPAIANDLMDGN
jgi:aquaporin Z